MRFAVSTPVFTLQPSHIHTLMVCTAMITPLDLLIHESSSSQVELQPVMSVILSCPLIFPACLSHIDCLVVPDRGGLGSFDMEKFVCLSVWSAEVTQQYVCLPGQLNPLTEQAGEEKWWGEKDSLVAFPPCVFFFWWRWPDHQALYPNSQIRCLESLHMT